MKQVIMIIMGNGRATLGDVTAELARLEQLVVDLRHIAAGHVPNPKNIETAPVLHKWVMTPRPLPALAGFTTGHPNIADGHPTVTSPVEILDPVEGWCRTGSRLYRLGFHHGDRKGIAH